MLRQKGFTLLELMITMAIIAIIAAVAYPSYLKSAMKGRRADGKAELNLVTQAMERCYGTYGTYNNTNCTPENSTGSGPSLTNGMPSQQGYYTITGTVTGTTYSLTATAVTTGPQANDTGCTTMTVSSTSSAISPSGC